MRRYVLHALVPSAFTPQRPPVRFYRKSSFTPRMLARRVRVSRFAPASNLTSAPAGPGIPGILLFPIRKSHFRASIWLFLIGNCRFLIGILLFPIGKSDFHAIKTIRTTGSLSRKSPLGRREVSAAGVVHARRYDDCTICWAGEAYAKLLDWDRPAPNASLFDYDDGVPKQCTIDAGEYAAKGIDDLQHQCSSLHEIESNRELRRGAGQTIRNSCGSSTGIQSARMTTLSIRRYTAAR